jgi:hypothetical protein
MSSSSTPEGPGSVSGPPRLPGGFAGTFTSRYVDTGDLRQHLVTGRDGGVVSPSRTPGTRTRGGHGQTRAVAPLPFGII